MTDLWNRIVELERRIAMMERQLRDMQLYQAKLEMQIMALSADTVVSMQSS